MAWRWPDMGSAADEIMFRGVVGQTEDELSQDRHTVTVTCHDVLAQLARRYLIGASPVTYTNTSQDQIVTNLVAAAQPGGAYANTSYLPVFVFGLTPTKQARAFPDPTLLRTRTYMGGQSVGGAIDDLARVSGGFDYSVQTQADGRDFLDIWYPNQGIARVDPQLVYGDTVSALTRSVNSADYGNYWRVTGNNGQSDPMQPQYIGEATTVDATDATSGIGLWQLTDDASDVTIVQTLIDKAQGDALVSGQLVPAYTLTLRPGFYKRGGRYSDLPATGPSFEIGDTVSLVVQSGRLNVNTTVRVLGITYDIGDDGEENVSCDVGRPTRDLADLLITQQRSIQALNRR